METENGYKCHCQAQYQGTRCEGSWVLYVFKRCCINSHLAVAKPWKLLEGLNSNLSSNGPKQSLI